MLRKFLNDMYGITGWIEFEGNKYRRGVNICSEIVLISINPIPVSNQPLNSIQPPFTVINILK